jgi:hypothetical protein
VPALPARGGPGLVHRLFEPLGWTVTAEPVALDTEFPAWGDSRYVRLVLESERLTLAEALRHLYVLLPVLDDAKHYWVSEDEVDKLLRAGEGWLHEHPAKELITRRYLANRRSLAQSALERLRAASDELEAIAAPEAVTEQLAEVEAAERRKPLVTSGTRRYWRRSPSQAPPGCSTWAAARELCCCG